MREETFARQKREGVIPNDAVLTARPASLPVWASLSADERRIASRLMEVAAAQSAFFDAQLGRLIDELKADGLWNNTLIVYVNGDNGAAHVGGPLGSPLFGIGPGHTVEHALAKLDVMGSEEAPTNFNTGWAWATNTPFQYWKQMSGHLGGIRNGLTISWPGHLKNPGSFRPQFGFVTDIAPTIYEATGANVPTEVDGARQTPLDGISLLYTFQSPSAPPRRTSQYFEINGHRGYYKDGWFAGTTPPSQIWKRKPAPPLSSWNWELYNLNVDYSQSRDLAKTNPGKLAELRQDFDRAAQENGFKLREVPEGRPERTGVQPFWANGRESFTLHPSPDRLADQAIAPLLGRTWSVEATLYAPGGNAQGTIISQGQPTAGWGLYLVEGHPTLVYAAEPFDPVTLRVPTSVRTGHHTVRLTMTPDGPGRSQPLTATIVVDGGDPTSFRIEHPIAFLGLGGIGLGRTFSAPLPVNTRAPFVFNETIDAIRLTLAPVRPN